MPWLGSPTAVDGGTIVSPLFIRENELIRSEAAAGKNLGHTEEFGVK